MNGRSCLRGWKVLGLLTCLCLVGCSSKATVEGTVSYKGKPLPAGTVTFFVGNQVVNAPIDADGKYKALNVPPGEAKVTVKTPTPASSSSTGGMMSQGMSKMKSQMPADVQPPPSDGGSGGGGKVVQVPSQYNEPGTSGLTTTVKAGKNSFDIDLK